ncbi:MAG: 5-formyltetrahydrofolate cyclo-ligase [Bariatricus sp.]
MKQRSALPKEEAAQKSRAICRKILSLEQFVQAETVLLYMNFKNEVETGLIWKTARNMGKCVASPRIIGSDMVFSRIQSEKDLIPGKWGIPEPKETCPVIREHDNRTVVIMPGVAFDGKKNRIGYGGGYYDRYFSGLDAVYKIAAAYDLQIVERIPAEPFDLKPDCIVTETRIYAG